MSLKIVAPNSQKQISQDYKENVCKTTGKSKSEIFSDYEVFSKFGHSSTQSKIYLFLNKNGPKNVNEISKFLKLSKAKTYSLLIYLQNKKIVIANSEKSIKFEAVPFEKAVHILVDAEKSRIDKLRNEIPYMISLWNMIPYDVSYKGFPTEKTIQI